MDVEYPPLLLTYAGAPGGVGPYQWDTPEDVVEVDGKTALELLRMPHAGFREPVATEASIIAQQPAPGPDHNEGYIQREGQKTDLLNTKELHDAGVIPQSEGPLLQEATEVAAPPNTKRGPGRPPKAKAATKGK